MDASIRSTCTQVRRDIINMTADAGCGHPGGSLSIVEALVALYFDVMNIDPKNPKAENRDRFVLSKGHAAPALYAVLGERGIGLSEGQAQRVAVARALLSGAPILLLDEATSALDEKTEARLLENISAMREKTCIIVTHRRAALEICDYTLHIADGKMTETAIGQGTVL